MCVKSIFPPKMCKRKKENFSAPFPPSFLSRWLGDCRNCWRDLLTRRVQPWLTGWLTDQLSVIWWETKHNFISSIWSSVPVRNGSSLNWPIEHNIYLKFYNFRLKNVHGWRSALKFLIGEKNGSISVWTKIRFYRALYFSLIKLNWSEEILINWQLTKS